MDLPKALDSVLTALLCEHTVTSWKIAAEGNYPTVVLRLRPVNTQDVTQNTNMSFRRKAPSQINRDKKRMENFAQRKRKQLSDNVNASEMCLTENVTIDDAKSVTNLNRDSGSVDLESQNSDRESVNSTASVARNAGDAAGTCSTHEERREETRECVTQSDIDPETQRSSPPGHVTDQGSTGASNSEVFYQQAPMEYMDSDTESIWSAGLPFDNQWTREITARRNKRRGHRLGGGDKGKRGPNSTTIRNSSTRKSPPHPTPSGYMVELDGVTDTLVKKCECFL